MVIEINKKVSIEEKVRYERGGKNSQGKEGGCKRLLARRLVRLESRDRGKGGKIIDDRISLYVDAVVDKRRKTLLNKILNSLPRAIGVACCSRRTTGHDYLQKHLQRIGVKDSACCPLCHRGDMDSDHLKNCHEVLKFLADNSFEANERLYSCFYS
ncbi:hypothetical protein NPIL_398721 [Nephila pilipes]|uniref:Uncharacterized protein n=1 Tax=Nephila pilipes TaxID=299642 RepID=A0A8X6TG98_NEPPI|nr:hypothetical protein NPIL_398721 [Nephila pilipes]